MNEQENNKKMIEMLAKMLAEKESSDVSTLESNYSKLYSYFFENVVNSLTDTSFPEKSQFVSNVKSILDRMFVFCKLPQLAGKTIIGVFDQKFKDNNFLKLWAGEKAHILFLNRNLVCFGLPGEGDAGIEADNKLDSRVKLSYEEYRASCTEFYKHNINIENVLQYYIIGLDNHWENVVFVYIPACVRKGEKFKKIYLILDAVIDLQRQSVKVPLFNARNIEKILYNENDKRKKQDAPGVNAELLVKWIDQKNTPRLNYLFSVDLWKEINRVLLANKEEEVTLKINEINSSQDALMAGENERETISAMKSEISQKLDLVRHANNDFLVCANKFMEMVNTLEQELKEKYAPKGVMKAHNGIDYSIVEVCRDFELLEDKKNFSNYFSLLQNLTPDKSYLVDLFGRKRIVNDKAKQQIDDLKNDDLSKRVVQHLWFKFRDKLDVDEKLLVRILTSEIPRYELNEEELEYLGDYYKKNEASGKAIGFYRQILQKKDGNIKGIGKKLLNIPAYRADEKNLKFLANCLDVDGVNFYAGFLRNRNNNELGDFWNSLVWYKKAAALGDKEALLNLAKIYYELYISDRRKKINNSQYADVLEKLLHVLKLGENHDFCCEILGNLAYDREDYGEADYEWGESHTATAYYRRGKLNQYGIKEKGFPQNLTVAKECFKNASKFGHLKAAERLASVNQWIVENQEIARVKKESRSRADYHGYHSSSPSGGGCFITTATCFAMDLSDDNAILNTMRWYRDRQLADDFDGKALTEEYYRVAPYIIEKVNNLSHKEEVYREIYFKYLAKVYEFLIQNDFLSAKVLYIEMVYKLTRKFKIGLKKEIYHLVKEYKENGKISG